MAIGKVKIQGIASDNCDPRKRNIRRNAVDPQGPFTGPLIYTTGAGAGAAKLHGIIGGLGIVGPFYRYLIVALFDYL